MAEGFVNKTHRAAVVVIPPRDIWEPIQSIRRQYDRHLKRWMPHVTLLYPFRPRALFDEAEPELRRACATIQPFRTTLSELRHFSHGRERFTLWLATEHAPSFTRLQAALQDKYPDCDDTSRHAAGFVPHLSVGQAVGRSQLRERLGELRTSWQPIAFDVEEIALISREGDEDPFAVDRTVALGDNARAGMSR
jgi:RNA 2',3'-cyclic 3'-phosphodiesterase